MTEIEEAFRLCANLTSVDFGENSRLTTIGEYAFQSCPIESVVIPSSVTEIEQGAFSGGVKSITFEENSQLTTIGQNAFANGLYTNIRLLRRSKNMPLELLLLNILQFRAALKIFRQVVSEIARLSQM